MSDAFNAFLAQAWADHADHSEAVAERLRTETPAPSQPAQLVGLVRFVVHLLGEHLGRFDDARWRLAALKMHPLADPSVQSVLRVAGAALALAQSKPARMADFSDGEKVRAEASAGNICLGREQTAHALALVASARRRLAAMAHSTPGDHRPLAVACNNMAWELHGRGNARSSADTAAMLDIASASREHWAHAGTWVEVERADYCLALTHLSAGNFDAALGHATRCLASCREHDAPPYELLFAQEALARTQHASAEHAAYEHHAAAARTAFDRLASDDQVACRRTLDAVLALSGAR